MILLRKITFWISLFGLISTAILVVRLRADLGQGPKPPPIAPPQKPFAHGGIGASGLVEAIHDTTEVGSPVSALVTQVFVQPWDKVKADTPLFRLDDRELQAALLTQRAQVVVAEATLHKLQDQVDRLESVSDPRAISTDELKTRRNDSRVAAAQLEAARATVNQSLALIERLTVRAPIDGTILQVNIRTGEFVSPSAATAPLLLGNIDEVQVRADVDEQIAPRVKPGKDAVGYLKGDTTTPIPLKFVRIEPYVVPKRSLTGSSTERVDTRVLQVIFRFANSTERPVYVGQQLDLYIEE